MDVYEYSIYVRMYVCMCVCVCMHGLEFRETEEWERTLREGELKLLA